MSERQGKKKGMVQVWAKVPDEWRDALQGMADAEHLDLSDVVRRAVRQYLDGGAEAWATLQRDTANREPTPLERAGRWFSRLRPAERRFLYRAGEGLLAPDAGLPAWLDTMPDNSQDDHT